MPGARKRSAAAGDREADGGAEAPERGAEGAREDVPAAAVPHELRAGAAAGPGSRLPAPVKPSKEPGPFRTCERGSLRIQGTCGWASSTGSSSRRGRLLAPRGVLWLMDLGHPPSTATSM